MSADAGTQHRGGNLTALPSELRNQIYHLVLLSEPQVSIDGQQDPKKQLPLLETPGLLRTCRQIEREASSMWYGNTVFCYDSTSKLLRGLHTLGTAKCMMLRIIRCSQCCHNTDGAEWYLRQMRAMLEEEGLRLAGPRVFSMKCMMRKGNGKWVKEWTRWPAQAAARVAKTET